MYFFQELNVASVCFCVFELCLAPSCTFFCFPCHHLLLRCFFPAEFASLSATGATESDGDGKKRALHTYMDVSDSDLPLPIPKRDLSGFSCCRVFHLMKSVSS